MGIIDIITKDVISENESKRGMVSLRILYIALFVAFSIDLVLVGFSAILLNPFRIALFYVLILVLFWQTYHTTTRTSIVAFVLFLLYMILSFIPVFGWSAGMQNYFIVILMLSFFAVHGSTLFKFLLAGLVLLARAVTIFLFAGTKPETDIGPLTDKFLQLTNITAVFISIIMISYIFSRDENAAESKLMKFNDRLMHQAVTDPLTGLYNRRRAREYMDTMVKNMNHDSISVAIGDIDFFKKVNDTYGHDAGDEVLKYIAETFKDLFAGKAFISRYGGEEFLIVFPGLNGDEAYILLEDMRKDIQNSTVISGEEEIRVTMTFGLTEFDFNKDIDHTIKEADDKLYKGKSSGRNCVIY